MTRKGTSSITFKTSFDTPLGQWTRLKDEGQARELLRRITTELAKYVPALARSTSRATRSKSEPSSEKVSCPILIGLNTCTRALERLVPAMGTRAKGQSSMMAAKELVAVLVCKDDVTHARIFQHLPFLGRLCHLPVLPLPKGSAEELGTLFGLPSCAVVGILRDHSVGADGHWELEEFVKYLVGIAGESVSADTSQYRELIINRTIISKAAGKKIKRKKNGPGEKDAKKPKVESTT